MYLANFTYTSISKSVLTLYYIQEDTTMEANHSEHWKLFHREKDLKTRTNFVIGTVLTPLMVLTPFIFLWVLMKING